MLVSVTKSQRQKTQRSRKELYSLQKYGRQGKGLGWEGGGGGGGRGGGEETWQTVEVRHKNLYQLGQTVQLHQLGQTAPLYQLG